MSGPPPVSAPGYRCHPEADGELSAAEGIRRRFELGAGDATAAN